MKIAGILGGFGPEATAKFQLEIVELFRAQKIKTRPPLLIWNTPIPLSVEKKLVLESKGIKNFLPFLIDGARKLERGGADFLIIPCNTLHLLINDLQKSVDLPIINLIEATTEFLSNKKINSVGIMANSVMIESSLHQWSLMGKGIKPIVPSKNEQIVINKTIDQILANENLSKAEKTLRQISKNLQAKGAKDILLACTDLQQIFPKIKDMRIHDTLQILAETTVSEILQKRRWII